MTLNAPKPVATLRRAALVILLATIAVLSAPSAAQAHEFGPFAIDRYAGIRVAPDELEIDYVLSLAETPTQADGDSIEADPDAYCTSLLDEIDVIVDDVAIALPAATTSVDREDGDGGLTTLRVVCNWTTALDPAATPHTVEFDDANYDGRVGWREIIVIGDRTEVSGDVRDESLTERLTDYPDPDENPEERRVAFEALASADADEASLPDNEPGEDDGGGDAFSDLIADADSGFGAQVLALGFAAFLGALHSLAPGHGKSVIGAYLVGTKGTKFQAFILAIAVALSHTLGVLILGLITYAAGAAFAPENVYPWLQGVSAVIVFGIGVWLVWTAVSEYKARTAAMSRSPKRVNSEHGHATHDHDHDHTHDHDHDHTHDHDHAHATSDHADHDHAHDEHTHDEHLNALEHDHPPVEHEFKEAAVALLTGSAAVADAVDHHDHGDHTHDHDHDHGDHTHDHDHANHDHGDHTHDHGDHGHDHGDHDHTHDHDHDHDHGDGWHRHGIFPHTHKFDLDEMDLSDKVSWKTLAVLGLSGGLVPSTSAIIVLLGAIQLNRIAFGGALILAFGIGMAIALVSVGLGMVALRDKAFGAMDGNSMIRTARIWVVPIAAGAVLIIGIFLLIRAGIQISDI